MGKWIKSHKRIFAGWCLVVYVLATAIPIGVSYGLLGVDLRPLILVSDGFAALSAVICFVGVG